MFAYGQLLPVQQVLRNLHGSLIVFIYLIAENIQNAFPSCEITHE